MSTDDAVLEALKAKNVSTTDLGNAVEGVLERLMNCPHAGYDEYCEDCGSVIAEDEPGVWVRPNLLDSLIEDLSAAMTRVFQRGPTS